MSEPSGPSSAPISATTAPRRSSLRRQLLLGILLPVLLFLAVNSVSTYRQALRAADTAYDRTLLASAKSIGESLEVVRQGSEVRLQATLSYASLEPFEADNRSRLYYRITGFQGEMVSGFDDLPRWSGRPLPKQGLYAALVDFYDDEFRGQPVRMAVLLQPVAGLEGLGMATIQVAETLELRRTLARSLLIDTLWRQAALLVGVAVVVVLVVQHATRPVRRLSALLAQRAEGDLSPLPDEGAPRELQPLLDATHQVMARLDALLAHQKRFVRDASHQLRTPLAVLKTQVQSARRGDVPPLQALAEISDTVDQATELANQMLALAKVEQLRHQSDAPLTDWAPVVRQVALDVSALLVDKSLDFDLHTEPASVRSHVWALKELTRNLLHNAIRHTPASQPLTVTLHSDGRHAALTVADSGSGIGEAQRLRLFQPFSAGDNGSGSGLGLAICHDIVDTLGGSLTLENRIHQGHVMGLDAIVRLPLDSDERPA
jgi:two-component system sensor histidine kinase TctE